MASHATIVTFEGTRANDPNSGHAVIQRGNKKKIVSRATGIEILEGRKTITFSGDEGEVKRSHKKRQPKRTVMTGIQMIRMALGLEPDDESVKACTCNGSPRCTICRGIGYIVTNEV